MQKKYAVIVADEEVHGTEVLSIHDTLGEAKQALLEEGIKRYGIDPDTEYDPEDYETTGFLEVSDWCIAPVINENGWGSWIGINTIQIPEPIDEVVKRTFLLLSHNDGEGDSLNCEVFYTPDKAYDRMIKEIQATIHSKNLDDAVDNGTLILHTDSAAVDYYGVRYEWSILIRDIII